MIVPVILSGGSGTRLWPLSRELCPKQFLSLTGDNSMLQETLNRLKSMNNLGLPVVVCNEEHRFIVAEQLRQIDCAATIILEPLGRNTAPALAVAALQAVNDNEDPLLLVLPADHVVTDPDSLIQTIINGRRFAEAGKLLTFGIVPGLPETGYGYIKAGEKCELADDHGVDDFNVCSVDRFIEKPDLAAAKSYVESGDYYWNSGMFLLRASRYLEELEKHAPDIVAACNEAWQKGQHDLDFYRLDQQSFAASPSDSIDYAVMEKTSDAAVLPLSAGWSDVGSWSALWEIGHKNKDGNVIQGDVLTTETINTYINASSRLVATIGLNGFVVVETPDAVLVAPRDRVQQVKDIVSQLKDKSRPEIFTHKKVSRPWGTYECVDVNGRYQVKRITVLPGAKLSLQMHHHRAEHWIVVRGTAKITKGEKVFNLTENESTYIPLGEKHRLENPGKILLELIEVQSGSYLGEDDIVRFEDTYGR